MIFVTVGTHEQQFDRLIRQIDILKQKGIIQEEVFIQTGYSAYEPKSCEWANFISYTNMLDKVKKARVVITHGGPASFIMPLQEHKIPIVVPRQIEYNEHINNHQVEFTKFIEQKQKNIIVVMDIEKLESVLTQYDTIINKSSEYLESNNYSFNIALQNTFEKLSIGDKK